MELQWGHILSDVDRPERPPGAGLPGGFNGATSFQMWIGSSTVPLKVPLIMCFNGATSFQMWIAGG